MENKINSTLYSVCASLIHAPEKDYWLCRAIHFSYMENMEWDDLRYFLAVARTGSLSAAAEKLRASPSTVSRRVSQLERALSVSLFDHHQTGYTLTDDGTDLFFQAETVELSVTDLEMKVAGRDRQPEGHVKFATAENLANYVILPEIARFKARYPGIVLEVSTGIGSVSLSRREADLAVRLSRPEQGNVNIRRIGTQRFGLYGSPDYLSRQQREGRTDFDYIVWGEEFAHLPMMAWLDRMLMGRPPALIAHSLYGQLVAARAGLGLAVLPCFLGDPEPGLRKVELEGDMVEQEIWLVIHRSLAGSARVRAVADFMAELFAEKRALLEGTT